MQDNVKNPGSSLPPFEVSHSRDGDSRFSQTVLESLPGTVYMLHADGRFARWNPCIQGLFAGKPDEEMPLVNAKEIVHPEDLNLVLHKMRNVLENGVEETVEIRLLMKGGPEFRWFLVTGTRLTIDGQPFLAGIGIDTTNRKRAEEALWQSEQRFRSIAEQIDAPVFITDRLGNVVYMSQAIEKLSGFSRKDVLGMPFSQFLEGEAIEHALAMFNEVLSDSPFKRVGEFRLRKKDGSICYAEIRLQFYHDNRIDGTIGLIYDLTQRKRFEALTSFRLRLLQMAGSATAEELMRTAIDEAERITDSSFGFFHFFESSGNDFPQRVWSERVRMHMSNMEEKGVAHPINEFAFWEEAVRKKSAVICNDYVSQRPPGFPSEHKPFVFNTLVVPVSNADGVAAVFVLGNKQTDYDDNDAGWVVTLVDLVWDIVERQRAEQSESRLQALLMQIQKMEIVGQLAGGIAHDFNNLLGVILGNAEIALSDDSIDLSVKRNLEEISKAAERSAELTSQLLAFARKQTALPQLLDLNTVVEGTLNMLQGLIGEKISIVWKPDSKECLVQVDPDQIDQILTSLCLNARDAMAGAGTITIGTMSTHIEGNGSDVSNSGMYGDFVELSIFDTGHGIDQEHRAHIFEPFYTTKPFGKGTGLGLSTVYGIIKQNRGFIDFDTEIGTGTVFRVYLPLLSDSTGTTVERKSGNDTERGKNTIMVVEDEPEILNLCRLMLEKTGYRVLSASSPTEAIRLAEVKGERIDLLLTDVIMPEMNGNQLSARLLTIIPGLKTLFMSGYTADIIACHGVLDSGVNFIQKPFTVMGLSKKVKEVIAL
jgi:PAS domain S-box-containing protein